MFCEFHVLSRSEYGTPLHHAEARGGARTSRPGPAPDRNKSTTRSHPSPCGGCVPRAPPGPAPAEHVGHDTCSHINALLATEYRNATNVGSLERARRLSTASLLSRLGPMNAIPHVVMSTSTCA